MLEEAVGFAKILQSPKNKAQAHLSRALFDRIVGEKITQRAEVSSARKFRRMSSFDTGLMHSTRKKHHCFLLSARSRKMLYKGPLTIGHTVLWAHRG